MRRFAGTGTLRRIDALLTPLVASRGTVGLLALFHTGARQFENPERRNAVEAFAHLVALAIERDILASEAQVAAVRDLIGPDTPFQVDANTAYRRTDGSHLARLDEFDLLLIEQPLPEEDIIGHARLAAEIETPICLDESLVSTSGTADAIDLGACEIANIKPGRVGGYLEAVRIHDLCVAKGIPVWCGGMLETGIGRAANAALAALPGFTLPGDISASTRFYARDIE